MMEKRNRNGKNERKGRVKTIKKGEEEGKGEN